MTGSGNDLESLALTLTPTASSFSSVASFSLTRLDSVRCKEGIFVGSCLAASIAWGQKGINHTKTNLQCRLLYAYLDVGRMDCLHLRMRTWQAHASQHNPP